MTSSSTSSSKRCRTSIIATASAGCARSRGRATARSRPARSASSCCGARTPSTTSTACACEPPIARSASRRRGTARSSPGVRPSCRSSATTAIARSRARCGWIASRHRLTDAFVAAAADGVLLRVESRRRVAAPRLRRHADRCRASRPPTRSSPRSRTGPRNGFDLRSNTQSSLGQLPAITQVVGGPSGQRAVVVDITHRARIVGPVGEPIELPGNIDRAAFVDAHRLALATSTGAIVLDEDSHRRTLVHVRSRRSRSSRAAADGGWIAAGFGDRVVWRTGLEAAITERRSSSRRHRCAARSRSAITASS